MSNKFYSHGYPQPGAIAWEFATAYTKKPVLSCTTKGAIRGREFFLVIGAEEYILWVDVLEKEIEVYSSTATAEDITDKTGMLSKYRYLFLDPMYVFDEIF